MCGDLYGVLASHDHGAGRVVSGDCGLPSDVGAGVTGWAEGRQVDAGQAQAGPHGSSWEEAVSLPGAGVSSSTLLSGQQHKATCHWSLIQTRLSPLQRPLRRTEECRKVANEWERACRPWRASDSRGGQRTGSHLPLPVALSPQAGGASAVRLLQEPPSLAPAGTWCRLGLPLHWAHSPSSPS